MQFKLSQAYGSIISFTHFEASLPEMPILKNPIQRGYPMEGVESTSPHWDSINFTESGRYNCKEFCPVSCFNDIEKF